MGTEDPDKGVSDWQRAQEISTGDRPPTFFDYGEGKTREQESRDSVRALAYAIVFCSVCLALIVGILVWAFY